MRELKQQLISALLVVLTAAALVSAGINFQQQRKFPFPDDGVTWADRGVAGVNRVVAIHIQPDSAAQKAGIKAGDVLTQINGLNVHTSDQATRALVRLGPWSRADYVLERGGLEIKAKVIVGERPFHAPLMYQYLVGAAYLGIGLFVYYRRATAPFATHFYILCLASFLLSTFHYTGKLNNFDKVMYWGNVAAGLFAPTIFLHFCLRFPGDAAWFGGRWRAVLLYLPAAAMMALYLGFGSGTLRAGAPLMEISWLLDRGWLLFLTLMYLSGGAVLSLALRKAEDPVTRQQLKWLRNGAVLGVVPFAVFNAVPYVFGAVPGPFMNLSALSLVLIPLTWAYAILRHRLMDVDVIFQQGYAYTLATLAVMAVLYSLIVSMGTFDEMPESTIALLVVVAMFLFQPIRNWIQEMLDRHVFYKDRYDYRRTLIDFARELSRETDLAAMLASVSDRVRSLLHIRSVAFFLADGADGFRLVGPASDGRSPSGLDLSFLRVDGTEPLFFERTRHAIDTVSREMPAAVRQTIAALDLTYYFPCTVHGRAVAYLGVSRTTGGDFLPSEDMELLTTLAGYVGIAIENALLYRSLEQKVSEYERLKEFSENIVESINVGIVAADLDDRVESWNSRMEQLTGISRERAHGHRLGDLFAPRLAAALEQVRGETGVQHLYKFALRPQTAGNSNAPDVLSNVAIAPLVSKDGEKIGRLIIFDDITERTVLEQRLVQADKLSSIGLLAAGVAHEVNTPLAVISTYAQMLAKQLSGDETKSTLLDKIAKQTFRASEIVNSLLNFSRTSKTEFENVDLARIIRETLALVEHQLAKAGVKVDASDLPPLVVRANSGKMQQVFLNLFLNARDALEASPNGERTLRIHAVAAAGLARVQVQDTGKGIPPADIPRIFDPFFTTKGAKKGTGLGLSVTYGIIREHGGTIDVESRHGAGASFLIELPLAASTSGRAAEPAPAVHA
jgi:hypothetical protein